MIALVEGKTASGKSAIVDELKRRFGYHEIISYTTRQPRPGEEEGVNYFFLSREAFLAKKEAGGFVEIVEYNGNFYGTGVDEAREAALSDTPYAVVVTPEGGDEIAGYVGRENTLTVYVEAPQDVRIKRFLERGLGEGVDNIAVLRSLADRLEGDEQVFAGAADRADFIVTNGARVDDPERYVALSKCTEAVNKAVVARLYERDERER